MRIDGANAEGVQVGLAGWANPPQLKSERAIAETHLEHYARHFSCVEINSTFYRTHRPDTFARWHDSTPGHFRFSVKMPRTITHENELRGVRRELKAFFDSIKPLREKLAVVLVQLPPSQEFSMRTARTFFMAVSTGAACQIACEPRHESWFSTAADALLSAFGVARVAADPPRASSGGVPGGAQKVAYFRWHGAPQMYYSSYSSERLASFANALPPEARDIWCIFDNTARGAAWPNALSFLTCINAGKSSLEAAAPRKPGSDPGKATRR